MLETFFNVQQDSVSTSYIKQEDDRLDIVDNLKQEEPTQHFQSENGNENYVNVLDNAELTASNIKQECEEEDPLNIADDLKQEVQTQERTRCNFQTQTGGRFLSKMA